MFDYEKDTRDFYQSDDVAQHYHSEFTQLRGLNGLRFRFISNREQTTVRSLMSALSTERVIDIPAGTGKMASLFKEFGCQVLACDVSENMLKIARQTYRDEGPEHVSFTTVDLESATENLDERFDVVVCVRLMHRVPNDVKSRMLAEVAQLAPYAIVSFGVDSVYQRLRSSVRRALFKNPDRGIETRPTRGGVREIVEGLFEVVREQPVAVGLSAERMYLLKSREFPAGD